PALCLDLRRRPDAGDDQIPAHAAATRAGQAGMGDAPAPPRRRGAVRHRARGRSADDLSRHLDASRLTSGLLAARLGTASPHAAHVTRSADEFLLKTFNRIW